MGLTRESGFNMAYLFLTLVLLSGATKGYCGKKTSGYVATVQDSFRQNLLRMSLCAVISALLLLFQGNISALAVTPAMLIPALCGGVCTVGFVVCWQLTVRKNAYMMVDVFLTLGTIVTVLACRLFFGDVIRSIQWLFMGMLVVASFVMSSYNSSLNGKMSPVALLLLLSCGLCNGLVDFSQKWFTHAFAEGDAAAFSFYTYVFAALTLGVILLVASLRERKASGERSAHAPLPGKVIGYIVIMAICLFANSYFKTLAGALMNPALLYPVCQGGALILSLVMCRVFFKEKITAKCLIGIALAGAAMILLNIFKA